jgi:hypothetical protein
MRKINAGNACSEFLSSQPLSKMLEIMILLPFIWNNKVAVLHGCETWSLTSREEHKLLVNGNKVLRKIYGSQRDEISEQFKVLCNKELCYLCRPPSIIRVV